MATAEEGGATTGTTTTSSYGGGGGGAGGKFRKRPFRKPTTPYDRPPVDLRGNNSKGSWLTKLVVDPASKLISYGAHRLFASVLTKRLAPPPPPPPPPQKSELNHVPSGGLSEAVQDSQYGAHDPPGGECSQPMKSSASNGISELEQLLKQKTFTRSEIDHLTELLHSRTGAASIRDNGKRNEEVALDFRRSEQFESSMLEAKRNERERSHGVVSTPISNSKVLEDSIASPAEVAKAYMGSRPSESSSKLHVAGEDNRLLGNMMFASQPHSMSLTTKTAVSPGSSTNGMIPALRSRGRSAIYNMARSPYFKGGGITHNGYGGLTLPSTSLSVVENSDRPERRSMTLKRRSYVLEDEVGSVGPIRRIRQKSNLVSPGSPHTNGLGIDSAAMVLSSKKKLPLIGDQNHVPRTVKKVTDSCIPSTSKSHAPAKSCDVAITTFERLTSKKKSLGLVAVQGRSPFRLTPSMLHGPALRSMEDLNSSEMLLNVQDDHEFESRSDATLLDAHDSSSQEEGKVEENGLVEHCGPSETCYAVINNDSAVSLKASSVNGGTSDSVLENGVYQPAHKRAFRMSALEDYVELDDDDLSDSGVAARPFSEVRGQSETHLMDGKFSPSREPKPVESTIQPEVKSPSGLFMSSKTSNTVSGTASVSERSNGFTIPGLEEASVAAQSAGVPPPVAADEKSKETNNPPPVFSFSSKVADIFPSLMPESSGRIPETKPESSVSSVNITAPTSSLVEIPEPENGGHLKPLAAEDRAGKSDSAPSASSNGPLVSSAPAWSFTAASSNSTNQISTNDTIIFTPSTSVSTFVPSGNGEITTTTSSGSILGTAAPTTISGGPVFKFGSSLDTSAKVSESSTTLIPAEGDLKTKGLTDPSCGSSNGSLINVLAFGKTSSGNISSGFSSSAGLSTANCDGTISHGTSVQPFPFAAPPTSSTSSSTPVSSLSSSQVFNSIVPFGFNSSTSSSGTGAIVSSNVAASSLFGLNPTPASDGSTSSSTSVANPSMFNFGVNSSSSSTNAVGTTGGAASSVFSFGQSSSASTSATLTSSPFSASAVGSSIGGAAAPAFNFGASSSVSASVTNTGSSFANGTTGAFKFGGSSSASSSAISSFNSNSTHSNPFGSSWQDPKSSVFGSTVTSPSPGFSFGASSTAPPSGPVYSFTTSPPPSLTRPVFGNNFQMNGEDSMAEDPVQSSAPSVPVFGQPSVSPSPPGFMFGSTVAAQANPFQFGGQQSQAAPQNPLMFQQTGSLEFNAGGSFSLGSGGGDKSGRKFVKANRSKNRKK